MSSLTLPPPSRSAARLLALALAVTLPSALTWLYFIRLIEAPAAVQQAVYATGKLLQFALPAAVVGLVLRRPLRLGTPRGRGVGEGVVSGIVLCAATAALYLLLGRLWPDLVADLGAQVAAKLTGLGLATGGRYLAVAVFYSVVHAALEEYYWRWFVYGQMRRFLRAGPALLLASLAFMAHHVILVGYYTGWGWIAGLPFSLAVAAGGAYWAWLYERSGSLSGPWISHLLVDAAIFAVGWSLL